MEQTNLFGAPPSPTKHFLQFKDFSSEEFTYLFERTRWIKEKFKRYEFYQPLRDRTLAMVFEKASTRTRRSERSRRSVARPSASAQSGRSRFRRS